MSKANTKTPIEEDLEKIFGNANSAIDQDPSTWLRSIRDKLFSMFCSPMKEEYLHEAFSWVSNLCLSMGDFSWMATDDKWAADEAKMFCCIARLSINEIHILLPLIQRHLTCDEPEIEDGKVVERSASSEEYNRFGSHLIILESVVKSLVKGQKFDDDDKEDCNTLIDSLKGEDLKSLLEKLKEVMTLNCDYLESVHHHWQKLITQIDSEKFSSCEGALRIMCVWLSEDPAAFEPQCKRFLIDLMVKTLLLPDRPTKGDLIVLALHSVCTNDEEMMTALLGVPYHIEALESYLKYVQNEQNKSIRLNEKHGEKLFKLRCGLVKDLMSKK